MTQTWESWGVVSSMAQHDPVQPLETRVVDVHDVHDAYSLCLEQSWQYWTHFGTSRLRRYAGWFKCRIHLDTDDNFMFMVGIPTHLKRTLLRFRVFATKLHNNTAVWHGTGDRLCRCCPSMLVESEMHVLRQCQLYSSLRFDHNIHMHTSTTELYVDAPENTALFLRACLYNRSRCIANGGVSLPMHHTAVLSHTPGHSYRHKCLTMLSLFGGFCCLLLSLWAFVACLGVL